MRDLNNALPKACEFYGNQFADFPFMLIENFLSADNCAAIAQDALNNPIEDRAFVLNENGAARIDSGHRSTDWRTVSEKSLAIYNEALDLQRGAIERFFNHILLEASKPQVLGYNVGDFYDSHADNCSKALNADGSVAEWKLIKPNRVITTLLFLNENFEGGELAFDYLFDRENRPCKLKPKTGAIVVFPSNPIFAHSVAKVASGYRLTIAQWHNAARV